MTLYGGIEAGGTKWICAVEPGRTTSERASGSGPPIPKPAESYLVPPGLGDLAGICGAFELARRSVVS